LSPEGKTQSVNRRDSTGNSHRNLVYTLIILVVCPARLHDLLLTETSLFELLYSSLLFHVFIKEVLREDKDESNLGILIYIFWFS
jgi:hypothetical protein